MGEKIKTDLSRAVSELFDVSLAEITLEHSSRLEYGDYASNLALHLAKDLGDSPKTLADKIAKWFNSADLSYLDRVEVAGPGFINFFLSDNSLIDQLKEVIAKGANYGRQTLGEGETVVIDYSAPNIAKPFGIGHLRSTIIGQALYNLHQFLGFRVVGDNHLGDWGTQFGKLIYAIRTWGDEVAIAKNPIHELTELYIEFHRQAALDPSLEEEGRRWFKRLADGDAEARRWWQRCVDWSLKEYDRIYDLLGVKIDCAYGESFYEEKVPEIVEEARRLGVAEESEGALVIPVDDGLPPLLLRKSDGASTYAARDLAAIKFRQDEFGPVAKLIYEVGADQSLHFKQLFLAAKKFPWSSGIEFIHVPHGMMRLASGKMSTREGRVILLEEVIDSLIEKARCIVEDKNPGLSDGEKDVVAKIVGVGALKYNDLSQNPRTDIVFDWDKALSLDGNSSPYLQYTYARCCSVLRKAGGKAVLDGAGHLSPEERAVACLVYRFPEAVLEAANACSPNLLSLLLFELAQQYNLFYSKEPILKAEGERRNLRLVLTAAVAQVLSNGLRLLGVDTLERM